jgi:hypothetical protein
MCNFVKVIFWSNVKQQGSYIECTVGFRFDVDKVKVKLSLCFFLTEHHAMKAYWGVEV